MHDLLACQVRCNEDDAPRCMPILRGQVWRIGPVEFEVTEATKPVAEPPPPRCSLAIETGYGEPLRATLTSDFLIGTAELCDCQVSRDSKLASRHVLITPRGGEWCLHDLTGSGGTTNGSRWEQTWQLRHNDEIQIGGMKIRVNCPERDTAVMRKETQTGRDTDPGSFVRTSEIERVSAGDGKTRMLAQVIYNHVKQSRALSAPPAATWRLWWERCQHLRVLQRAEREVVEGYPDRGLEQIKSILDSDPWDRRVLLSFAQICDAFGWDELCLYTLTLLHRQKRDDHLVLRAMARLCRHFGESDPRCLSKSVDFWQQVAELCPSEAVEINRTIQTIQVDMHLDHLTDFSHGDQD